MRTTVDIPDPLYRRLKVRAAREGRSAKELILRGVEQVLKAEPQRSGRRVKLSGGESENGRSVNRGRPL